MVINENAKLQSLQQNIETVIRGKNEQIQLVLTALLAGGHVLLEDNPGTGKTVLAKTLASSIANENSSATFKRVQFTPDLLPMDLLGTHIYDEAKKDFTFKKGPLFCNILLADEINRASPKVQSALLECMAENQITMGEKTYPLEKLFFTIATQNPIEMEGTYPLPAAQLDRFFIKMSIGYANQQHEEEILNSYQTIAENTKHVKNVITLEEILDLQAQVKEVYVHKEFIKSIVNICQTTRNHPDIVLGASTRGGLALIKCMQAFAFTNGREICLEGDLQYLAHYVLHHRLEFRNKEGKANALQNIIDREVQRLADLKIMFI